MDKIKEKLKDIEVEYTDLQDGIEKYVNNGISYSDLKGKGSKFGIYEQKGKKMMLRLKTVGGELSLAKLKALHSVMENKGIPYLHLSTRQNFQLHEVDFDKVKATIEECNENEMYFRGGGGNTFRSILVSTFTGVSTKNTFDVMPYARMIENEVFFYDRAFQFGRKLKIGLANNTDDEFVVSIQDMGFVAVEVEGKRGFKVYFGGGMGRGSRLGYVLTEFLPEEDLYRAVKAMIDIFYEHGDRSNRAKARLRFLVESMGVEAFRKMFFEYFDKSDVKNGEIKPIDYEKKVASLKHFEASGLVNEKFEAWKKVCVRPTRFKDVLSVVLYVKNGDLGLNKFERLIELVEGYNGHSVRATINQNLVLPLVHKSALEYIYNFLEKEIPEIVSETISVRGQIRSCVGSKVCMIGLQDSMGAADAIAQELDKLIAEKPQYRDIIFREAKNIRISGCGSSCAGIPIAPLGFIGTKKKIDDKMVDCMQVYMGGILTESVQALSEEMKDMVIPISEVPTFVRQIFQEYISILDKYDISFSTYMYERRFKEI